MHNKNVTRSVLHRNDQWLKYKNEEFTFSNKPLTAGTDVKGKCFVLVQLTLDKV